LFLLNPRPLGGNEGSTENFVPLPSALDLSALTAPEIGCFLIENIFDLAPGDLQTTIYKNLEVFTGFLQGILLPLFSSDGYFDCDISNFVKPSANASVSQDGSVNSSGSPVNGAYPGIGFIAPDSQPP
jgi:hypothetical protein